MWKVLIVDDEKPIRQWFEHVIRQCGDEFEIAGLAANGQEALKLCMSTAPDIVITDIKMPVMDGLELIEQARRVNADISFLILSNYDEFEFVRHGLRVGVKDYLLKAETDDQDIVAALRKISEGRKRKGVRQDREQPQLRDVLSRPEEWLSLELLQGTMRWVICGLDRTAQGNLGTGPIPSTSLTEVYRNWAEAAFTRGRIQLFVDERDDSVAMLIGYSHASAMPSDVELADRCRAWGAEARTKYDCTVSFGIGETFSSSAALHSEFRKAKRAYRLQFYTGEMSVHLAKGSGDFGLSEDHAAAAEIMKPLKSADLMESSLIKRVLQGLDEFKARLVEPSETAEAVRAFLERMEGQLIGKTERRYAESPDIFSDLERSSCWQELKEAVQRHLSRMQEIAYRHTFVYSETTNRIMAYLSEHYADKLSMSVLADQVHMNENYLSKLFKKETGKTITRYMIEVRMEQAKRLLATMRHKVNQVASEVGYASEAHFSTAFKTYYGITPSQYVDSLRQPIQNLSEPQ